MYLKTMQKQLAYCLFGLAAFAVIAGCTTLYSSTVTTTAVIESAMRHWAAQSVAGRTTKELDAKVIAAHRKYQEACAIARDSLIAYKAGGDQATYQKAFEATRVAMNAVLDIIIPLLTPTQAMEVQNKIGRATSP